MSVDLNMPQKLNNSAIAPHEKLAAAGLINKTVGSMQPPSAQTPKVKGAQSRLAQIHMMAEKKISTPSGKKALRGVVAQNPPGSGRPSTALSKREKSPRARDVASALAKPKPIQQKVVGAIRGGTKRITERPQTAF